MLGCCRKKRATSFSLIFFTKIASSLALFHREHLKGDVILTDSAGHGRLRI